MKVKTARRFLSRNQWKMIAHKLRINPQKPSFLKRWRECTKTVEKEKRIKK